jgi:hypothetical protein
VITSKEEASAITFPNVVVASDPETTVNEAIRRLRNGALIGCAVVGIDPGEEPGIAVLSDGIVEAVSCSLRAGRWRNREDYADIF